MRIPLWILVALSAAPSLCQPTSATEAANAFWLNHSHTLKLQSTGGFSTDAGTFLGLGLRTTGAGLNAEASAQYGVRLRRIELGLTRPIAPDGRLKLRVKVYAQRFRFDQSRDPSLLAFSRDVPESDAFAPENLMNFVRHDYGFDASATLQLRGSYSHAGLAYNFDVTGIRPLTQGASDYFGGLAYVAASQRNGLSGIRTSKLTASYLYNTVNHPLRPTAGAMVSATFAVAGLGGDVNKIEPAIEAQWYHRGLARRHVIATRLRARMMAGFGGKTAPPFDRFYTGGEQEVRGFSSWALSPMMYLPSLETIPVMNIDGSQRIQNVIQRDGTITAIPVTMNVPVYRTVSSGGDTKLVGNFEYRIPLVKFVTLALFTDAGLDRTSFVRQLQVNPGVIESLRAALPQGDAPSDVIVPEWSAHIRTSTGAELQVLVPRINLPVRVYWAYNVLTCGSEHVAMVVSEQESCEYFHPSILASPYDFPNSATYVHTIARLWTHPPYSEPQSMLRVAVGFTF